MLKPLVSLKDEDPYILLPPSALDATERETRERGREVNSSRRRA
jgi:hypothetical protein